MAAEAELAFIAKRIRALSGSDSFDQELLVAVWRLVRKAIELGAFAEVPFTEFQPFFDPQRESETFDTRRSLTGRPIATPMPVNKLPQTMLTALKWLAENGANVGLSVPASLPKLGSFESVTIRGPFAEFRIQCPNCDTLRPHIEFLASQIERYFHKHSESARLHEDGTYRRQAANLCAMYEQDWKRFKWEPVTRQLAAEARCYWLQYPLWLNMMGFPDAKRTDAQLIHNATAELDRAHTSATMVLMKYAEQLGFDSSSISSAATLCRELHRDDFWKYFSNSRQYDYWPESLGTELLKLPADQRQAIQTATATLKRLDIRLDAISSEHVSAADAGASSVSHPKTGANHNDGEFLFVVGSESVEVRGFGETVPLLQRTEGIDRLIAIVTAPTRRVSVMELARIGVRQPESDDELIDRDDDGLTERESVNDERFGSALGDDALQAARDAVGDLMAERDAAADAGDDDKAERLTAQINASLDWLKPDLQKAAAVVRKSLDRTYERLRKDGKGKLLGAHFAKYIERPRQSPEYVYQPDETERKISWNLK